MCLENGGKITKKIYCSVLSGVLLFFVLCLFSNSYAREVSSNDIANAIYNVQKAANNIELTKNDINLTICDLISTRFNNHQGRYCIFQYSNGSIIEFYYFDGNGKVYMTSNNAPYCNTGTYSIRYSYQRKEFLDNSFRNASSESYGTYTYNDGIIYTANNSNNIYWNANVMRPRGFNMFEETLFIDDYFTFNYNINLNNINITDFDVVKQVSSDYHGHNLADFGRTTHLGNVSLTYWKYEKDRGYFEPFIIKTVNSYTIISEDLGELYFTYDMFIPNTIMQFGLQSNDLENFESLSLFFYCVDSNTIINNGELDENNTFDDDYYNRYTNIINNILNENKGNITSSSGDITGSIDYTPIVNAIDDINNTLNDDSDTDSIISSNLSGDYESFGEDLGYHFWENPFFTFLINILEDFYDALTERGNIQISLNSHNIHNWILNTDDFVTPNSSLKNVCKLCLIFFYIYFNYKFFYHLITLVQTFRIKTTISVLGTDEFYDTDYM